MKYLAVLCVLFFSTLQMFSQQEYFMYLQTDNSQPFYVRVNNNVYSSTASGFLLLGKLADSTYSVTIGFPRNVFPEQQFNIPLNHKDAGYVLRNAGDKGWMLTNLQTAAVIISSSSPEQKKNTELSGSKRNDAFSMLMASAVNDSAVLYAAVRPPKPMPAPVAVEKKKDTLPLVQDRPLQQDSAATAKVLHGKKVPGTAKTPGSAARKVTRGMPAPRKPVTAKNTKPSRLSDSVSVVRKDTAAIVKTRVARAGGSKKKPPHDTAAVAKQIIVIPSADSTAKKTTSGKDSAIAGRANRQNNDTVFISGTSTRQAPSVAKNRKERKDTIILMTGAPVRNKPVAKNRRTLNGNKKTAALDSVQIVKKEILQAPEEKRNALLSNKDAVVIEQVPVKKPDSLTGNSSVKRDTIQTLANDETNRTAQPDTMVHMPARRLRPLVVKAAELLTDTSYVAVFVDESKDKFDTVRISIPFVEMPAPVRGMNAVIKQSTDRTSDSLRSAPAPSSTNAIEKKTADSIASADTPYREPAPRTDSTTPKALHERVPVTDNRALAETKKDSVAAAPDSLQTTKAPVRAPYLNSDCKEVATENDIDKLRIKMLLVTTDEDRIALAKKVFKQKCLLVPQVRALSELFKSDEGKYKWFDAAYPFVSDTSDFGSLGELIKDDYYLSRFKAMLRH